MTDMKLTADKVMKEFYRSCLGKEPTFKDDKIAVAATLKELINQLQQGNGMIYAPDILKVCEELEKENGNDVIVLCEELKDV